MSNKFYITVRRIYNTSSDTYEDKLYLSKSPDYSNLEEIDLEDHNVINHIITICRRIHWSGSVKIFTYSQPYALTITQGELVISPELLNYLHTNIWQDLFKGYVSPPPNGSIESIPDLLKDL